MPAGHAKHRSDHLVGLTAARFVLGGRLSGHGACPKLGEVAPIAREAEEHRQSQRDLRGSHGAGAVAKGRAVQDRERQSDLTLVTLPAH